jgi:hypothetical protein
MNANKTELLRWDKNGEYQCQKIPGIKKRRKPQLQFIRATLKNILRRLRFMADQQGFWSAVNLSLSKIFFSVARMNWS